MNERRPCSVNGKAATFHRWADKAQVLSPGMTIGSHAGGQIWQVVGIVEYADGTVSECYPYDIIPARMKRKDGENLPFQRTTGRDMPISRA